MNFEIIKLRRFSGTQCSVYSVLLTEEGKTLYSKFVDENRKLFSKELEEIVTVINAIAHKTGAKAEYFRLNEGLPGDGVCALYDLQNSNLRLYCIRYGKNLIIIGGGKRKNVRSWQDDPDLAAQVKLMMKISKVITERIRKEKSPLDFWDMKF